MYVNSYYRLRCFLFIVSFVLGVSGISKAQKKTEILWDNYGVPHVYASTTEGMYHAFGWAQMQSHANLLMQLYGQARGRAAEYWGEKFLQSDKQVRLFNIPDTAKQHYTRQTGENKRRLDAFVKGLNDYAAQHPHALDSGMKQVLPITVADVLAHSTRVICLEFLAGDDIREAINIVRPGSNAYAIAPSKSASKNAMLVTNPHLPWFDYFMFFEAQLTAPGFDAYGVCLVGQPVLNIAFNQNLGWTHTVNTIDASDRYELTLRESGYLLDGITKNFQRKTSPIKVLQPDGSFKIEYVELTYSEHGPVVSKKNGKAYAIRIAGLENAFLAAQYHQMAKAKNLQQFEAALKMLQNPMFNVIYADKGGNILYLFNGNVPRRNEGDWTFWSGVVDGRSSKYIWKSYHRYNELPKVLNPSTGFVQNANDPPWTSTFPVALNPKDYPSYMSPMGMDLRPQRAVNLIKDDASISFEELVAYKLNTGMEAADRFLDDLAEAVKQYPDTLAQKAFDVLRAWDRTTNANSRGAVLFSSWLDRLDGTLFSYPWSFDHPVTTPDGLKDPQKAVTLLVNAAKEVQKSYGRLDIPWGDVNRFKVGNIELPANGGPGDYGIFRTMYFSKDKSTNKGYAYHGDSYVAVTEFGRRVKAMVLLSYGNASQPGNKHIGDQLQLLSQKKLRRALLEKKEVLGQLEKREMLDMNTRKY